ncbi:MAG TPA: YHS domain-containing protein [Chitinophagaceae bacterium]|nr:YHS domain-containing protein [Chitinophagaceae bacterium]
MKNIFSVLFVSSGILLLGACNNSHSNQSATTPTLTTAESDSLKFTTSMVDNKRDPSCGMPLTAGIGDTVHYKGKVLGFCSKECKDEFMKDPEKNIAAADMKK